MSKTIATNCLVIKDNQILLGLKKRGFGVGRWNGFGGKVVAGESIGDSAKREILEESGLNVTELEPSGIINFEYLGEDKSVEVNFYKIINYTGEPMESEEMKPEWFNLNELPLKNMWPDDKYWLPLFIAGKKFKGNFVFEGSDKIISYTLEEI